MVTWLAHELSALVHVAFGRQQGNMFLSTSAAGARFQKKQLSRLMFIEVRQLVDVAYRRAKAGITAKTDQLVWDVL